MPADNRISHHDLCFGCGQANLFGLQLEAEPIVGRGVEGRFFVKQDHQGPPGFAHGGIIAAALDEIMALLIHGEGEYALTGRLEVDLRAPAPVGTFVRLSATVDDVDARRIRVAATAESETGEEIATAAGLFVKTGAGDPS